MLRILVKNQKVYLKKGLNIMTRSTTPYSVSYDRAADPSPIQPGSCPMARNLKKAARLIFFLWTMFTAIHTRKLRVLFGPRCGTWANSVQMSLVLRCVPFSMITSLRFFLFQSENPLPMNLSRASIHTIKEERKEIYPGLVSWANVLDLAARENVILAGGPFYLLHPGRSDSRLAYADIAKFEFPSPNADLSESLVTFSSTEANLGEWVTLLDARGNAVLHCRFLNNNLELLSSKCRNISSTIETLSLSQLPLYVDFPSSSADFDGSGFTSAAPSVLFFTLIANIFGALIAVKYLVPFIGVIWYTSGVSSTGAGGGVVNPGYNGIRGQKRDRSPNDRSLERFQPPRKKYRSEHPRMFLNEEPAEGRLFDISIMALLVAGESLSPVDPVMNSVFYYTLQAKCARCDFVIYQPMNWSTNPAFNSNCGACACHISIELEERGYEAFTTTDAAADRWVRILSFRAWNLRSFKYLMEGGTWRVLTRDATEYTFLLEGHHRMFVPAYMLERVNSFYYRIERRDDPNNNLVFEVHALRAIIRERVVEAVQEIGDLAALAA